MSAEIHIALLLDLVDEGPDEHPIDEAVVLACLPPAASSRVLRLTEFGARRCRTGTPDNWLPVLSAIERMLRAATAIQHGDQYRYWVAGRAGSPAWFHLGYRLGKKAIVTLVDRHDGPKVEVLPLDAASPSGPSPPYFERSPWPRRPSQSQVTLGWIVAPRGGGLRDQAERVMPHRSGQLSVIVEARASGALDAGSVGTALHELEDQAVGIRAWYPRAAPFSVFVTGPATFAFLAGRSLNPHAFPDVQVFQPRDHHHEPAYETRSQRRKHIILFMPANPLRTTRAALGGEAHDLEQELARCQYRDRFELQPQLAPRASDIDRHIAALGPSVIHFSGRGEDDGLVFHLDDGSYRAVSPGELGDIFRVAAGSVTVAVLNACFSEPHAEALLAHVACVVGMPGPIGDDAARSFAVGFYEALGDRASVQDAYDIGCLAMRLQRAGSGEAGAGDPALADDDRTRPRLLVRPGVDARALTLTVSPD